MNFKLKEDSRREHAPLTLCKGVPRPVAVLRRSTSASAAASNADGAREVGYLATNCHDNSEVVWEI